MSSSCDAKVTERRHPKSQGGRKGVLASGFLVLQMGSTIPYDRFEDRHRERARHLGGGGFGRVGEPGFGATDRKGHSAGADFEEDRRGRASGSSAEEFSGGGPEVPSGGTGQGDHGELRGEKRSGLRGKTAGRVGE